MFRQLPRLTAVLAGIAAGLLPAAYAQAARPSHVTIVTPSALPGPTARATAASSTRLLEVSVGRHVTLVGLRWRGSQTTGLQFARFVGARQAGAWTALTPNDSGVRTRGRSPEFISDPIWTQGATSIHLKARGVRDLTAVVVDPGANPPGLGRVLATARRFAIAPRRDGSPVQPTIVTRAQWGADESRRRAPPRYASTVRYAVVHHTDNPNDYTPAEAPAIVRGIYLYHVQSKGWNDIGYNALVDRYGVIYEGRYGGLDKPVIGAHALGFNTGSVGVALIGTYQTATPPQAQIDGLENFLAWRLDVVHVNPLASVSVTSGDSGRYPAGRVVSFPRSIIGHRDTGYTDCPGNVTYAELPTIAQQVDTLGGLRIFGPSVAGAPGSGPVRFTATVSRPSSLSVSVRTASGAMVWTTTGTGNVVDATWNPTSQELAAGTQGFSWEIDAADGTGSARPATGDFGEGGQPLTLSAPSHHVTPTTAGAIAVPITANSSLAGTLSIVVQDAAGIVIRTLPPDAVAAGSSTVIWDGKSDAGLLTPSGAYLAIATLAGAGGVATTASAAFTVGHGLLTASLSRSAISPNGDHHDDTTWLKLTRSEPTTVVATLLLHGRSIRRLAKTRAGPGSTSIHLRLGSYRDGSYVVRVVSTGITGSLTRKLALRIDRIRPVLSPQRLGQTDGVVAVRFRLSEGALVTLRNGHRPVVSQRVRRGRRIFRTRAAGLGHVLRLTAQDAAGNRARALKLRR